MTTFKGPYKRTLIAGLDAYPSGNGVDKLEKGRPCLPRLLVYPGAGVYLVFPGASSTPALAMVGKI